MRRPDLGMDDISLREYRVTGHFQVCGVIFKFEVVVRILYGYKLINLLVTGFQAKDRSQNEVIRGRPLKFYIARRNRASSLVLNMRWENTSLATLF